MEDDLEIDIMMVTDVSFGFLLLLMMCDYGTAMTD